MSQLCLMFCRLLKSPKIDVPVLAKFMDVTKTLNMRSQNTQIGPKPTKAALGTLNVHIAAADGDLEGLKEVAKENRSLLFKADHNGWRPIHEAARSGQRKVLEYLITEGKFNK